MGRKLDLSGLTDTEAEHVMQVVQRDMRLRKKEEERLSELRQELDEEGSRCLLLSRQTCFNRRCCIRCCSPFVFLLNPKRQCRDCRYNVCKACRVYSKQDKAWLCSACQKSRLLQTQSLEWFYTNVKRRFKRFGSSKVLKTLYKKHLLEHSALSELTEGSACEESICNEGSVCGSDSAFYRQTEEHSMAELLTVALRVAEEAIDEAISKAEFDNASQENEAHYLQVHREELIEELAKTIVQKIISRRKSLADTDLRHHHQSTCDQAFNRQPGLWRSHSAFSLLDNHPPGLIPESPQASKKDGGGSAMSTWKSVDRLDNAGASSVLKSPDGNWIALQSAQLSRPSLLAKRKSLVYSALERESGVVSAYEGMGSDNETKPEPDKSWGAVLQDIHRKMMDCNFNPQDTPTSDSEGNWKPNKPLLALLKRKVPAEIRRPSSSRRTSIIDVNFNVEGAGEEEEREQEVGKVRRSQKKKKSKKESAASSVQDFSREDSQHASDAVTPDTLTSGAMTPEPSDQEGFKGLRANQMDQELTLKLQQLAGQVSDPSSGEEEVDGVRESGSDVQMEVKRSEDGEEENERVWRMDLDEERTEKEEEETEIDGEMKDRLYKLVTQSRLTYVTSTDDDLDKDGQSEEEWEGDEDEDVKENNEQKEGKTDRLTYKLCQLEREVGANQFSSTEDELDRVGIMDEERTGEDQKDGKNVELAVKVCRLANQVNATQFSSTEDELDRAGRGEEGEEAIDDEKLWKFQVEKAVQAAQLYDLSSLVSASQFSPAERQLDRVTEGGIICVMWDEASGKNQERRESLGDLDVKMFDLRDEIEERQNDEKVTTEKEQDKIEGEENKTTMEKRVIGEVEDERMIKGQKREEKVLIEAENAKETEERQEMTAERTEEIVTSHETKVQQDNQPEAKWSDKNEGEERQEEEKISESKGSQGEWETAADSDDEDAEFDRVIRSMLTMTSEDMQGETLKDEAAENGRMNRESEEVEADENVKIGRESGAESTSASEETGSARDSRSRGDNVTPEADVTQGPGENVPEQVREDIPSKNHSEQLEKDNLAKDKSLIMTFKETPQATQTCVQIEVDDEQEDRRGKVTTEWQMTETHGDPAGGWESKETDGRLGEAADETEQSSTSSPLEGLQSPQDIHIRYSAVSLCSITTEVLRVLNTTEDLLQGVDGRDDRRLSTTSLPPNTDPKKLDRQFSRLEENVYVAAGAVYSLEAELSDLEECARGVCSTTSDMELSFLEEQVASAAAKVQQSELQICDISARIAALRSAGLDVDTQSRATKTRTIPFMPSTLDSSRQLRRRLPAPPVKEDKET